MKLRNEPKLAFHQHGVGVCALEKLARPLAKNGYEQYLLGLLGERVF